MNNESEYEPQRIRIFTDEDLPLALESLSAFLYDLVIIHDRLLLFSPEYNYQVPSGLNFYRRYGRKINKSDRLQISLITNKSPIFIEILVASASIVGLLWTVLKIVEKFQDWSDEKAIKRLDRKIKELQYRKLLREELEHHYPRLDRDQKDYFIAMLLRDVLRLDMNEQVRIKKVEAGSSQFSLDTEEQLNNDEKFQDYGENYK